MAFRPRLTTGLAFRVMNLDTLFRSAGKRS